MKQKKGKKRLRTRWVDPVFSGYLKDPKREGDGESCGVGNRTDLGSIPVYDILAVSF